MTADELRYEIAELLRDELELDVQVEGKRLVVTSEDDIAVILVSPVTRERLLREKLGRREPQP